MLFETPRCVRAPRWSLLLRVEHCLPCCAALCRARGNHNDGGFKTPCSCWESLERFFQFFLLPLALSLAFSPLHIALTFSFPCILTPHPTNHALFSHFSPYKCSLLKQLDRTRVCVQTFSQVCLHLHRNKVASFGDFKWSKHKSDINVILQRSRIKIQINIFFYLKLIL